jgi:hypothetical protein
LFFAAALPGFPSWLQLYKSGTQKSFQNKIIINSPPNSSRIQLATSPSSRIFLDLFSLSLSLSLQRRLCKPPAVKYKNPSAISLQFLHMEGGKKIKAFEAKVLARIKSNYKMHNHFCTLYIIQQKKRQEKTQQKNLWKQKLLC